MKKRSNLIFAIPFLLLACNNEGSKDSVETADSTNEARKERADSMGVHQADNETSEFLVNAVNGGMTEVRLGEIAVQNAASSRVKQMGEMMKKDHGAGNDAIKVLATRRNVNLPAAVSEDKQKEIDELAAKKGKDFDKSYVNKMIKAHEETIDMYQKATEKVNDPEVRTFANNKIPTIQMHLDSFKVIKKLID